MRTIMRRHSICAAGLFFALILGCSSPPTEVATSTTTPIPATATVSVTANPDGAAGLRFRITGGAVEDIQSAGGDLLFWEDIGGEIQIVTLLSDPASGPLFTVRIPDERVRDRYSVQVIEASDVTNEIVSAQAVSVSLQ